MYNITFSLDIGMIIIYVIIFMISIAIGIKIYRKILGIFLHEDNNFELFTTDDANDIHHYDVLQNNNQKYYDDKFDDNIEKNSNNSDSLFTNEISNEQVTIDNVDYDSYKNQTVGGKNNKSKTNIDENRYVSNIDYLRHDNKIKVSCNNKSISNKHKPVKIPKRDSCDQPNKLTAENYYKTYYTGQKIPMGISEYEAHNYDKFENYAVPEQISTLRILTRASKGVNKDGKNIPVASNYKFPTFYNTNILEMI